MESNDLLDQVIRIATEANQAEERVCPICLDTIDRNHRFPICADCFDNKLAPCENCGASTNRKGHYDFKRKVQQPLCTFCYQGQSKPKLPKNPQVRKNNISPDLEVIFERLIKANQLIDRLISFRDQEAVDKLEPMVREAERLCDEGEHEKCTRLLGQISWEKRGLDLAYRLGNPKDSELEGYTFWLWDAALIAYNLQMYSYGHEIMTDLDGILEYEDEQEAEADRREANSLANLIVHFKQVEARKVRETTIARNRQFRLEFNQAHSAPDSINRSACNEPAKRVLEHECVICSNPCRKTLCQECIRALDTCPTCRQNKVHVARDGRIMPNCYPCFLKFQ